MIKKYTQRYFKKKQLLRATHCCTMMDGIIDDERVPLEYISVFREYIIPVTYAYRGRKVSFCSWCGSGLPVSLRQIYFDTLSKELGINIDFSGLAAAYHQLPQEFKTDRWWKKRRL